jgi:hypothetical protein
MSSWGSDMRSFGLPGAFHAGNIKDHHVLVGHSILLGHMDGEAMLAVEEGRKMVETFEIQQGMKGEFGRKLP